MTRSLTVRDRIPAAFLALLVSLAAGACGNRGPLYLPDPEPPAQAGQEQDEPTDEKTEGDDGQLP